MLWAPLYMVLNYFTGIQTQDIVQAAFWSHDGITMATQTDVWNAYASQLSLLAKLVWSVPMLAYAVAKGSDQAMVGFIGGATRAVDMMSREASMNSAQTDTGKLGVQGNNASYSSMRQGVEEISKMSPNADGGFSKSSMIVGAGTNNSSYTDTNSLGLTLNSTNSGNIGVSGSNFDAKYSNLASSASVNATSNLNNQSMAAAKEYSNNASDINQAAESRVTNASNSQTRQTAINDQKTMNATDSSAKSAGVSYASRIGDNHNLERGNSQSTKYGNIEKAGFDMSKFTDGVISAGGSVHRGSDNSVVFSDKHGNTIATSYDETWNKNFQKGYSQSLAHSISSNKGVGEAFSRAEDYRAGHNENDTNSASSKYNEAYSAVQTAKQEQSYSKVLSSSNGGNVMNAFTKDYMHNNKDFKQFYNADGSFKSKEAQVQATNMMNDRMTEWGESAKGMKQFSSAFDNYMGHSGLGATNNIDNSNLANNVNGHLNSGVDLKGSVTAKTENIASDIAAKQANMASAANSAKIAQSREMFANTINAQGGADYLHKHGSVSSNVQSNLNGSTAMVDSILSNEKAGLGAGFNNMHSRVGDHINDMQGLALQGKGGAMLDKYNEITQKWEDNIIDGVKKMF